MGMENDHKKIVTAKTNTILLTSMHRRAKRYKQRAHGNQYTRDMPTPKYVRITTTIPEPYYRFMKHHNLRFSHVIKKGIEKIKYKEE